MRKLKLQMQISLDGFVDGPRGLNANWDEEASAYSVEKLESVDCIILGGNVGRDFVPYWASVASNHDRSDSFFGKRVTALPKLVFSHTLKANALQNTSIIKGDLTKEITQLKIKPGKDLLTYGGASFAAHLIKAHLIDEFHFFVNPAALGNGVSIFKELQNNLKLKLINSRVFHSGTVALCYRPKL